MVSTRTCNSAASTEMNDCVPAGNKANQQTHWHTGFGLEGSFFVLFFLSYKTGSDRSSGILTTHGKVSKNKKILSSCWVRLWMVTVTVIYVAIHVSSAGLMFPRHEQSNVTFMIMENGAFHWPRESTCGARNGIAFELSTFQLEVGKVRWTCTLLSLA